MELRLEPKLVQKLFPLLALVFGEAFGDIPTYSLHRIKNVLQKNPIDISRDLQSLLVRNLLKANLKYKEETGNDWNCLTSNNLLEAFGAMEKEVSAVIESIMNCPKECKEAMKVIQTKLQKEWDRDYGKIKQWFLVYYENLLYNTEEKIPWPIVQRLRSGLGLWIANQGNIFGKNINEMVIETASEAFPGKKFKSAEDAWKAMGGRLFRKEK